MGVEFKFGLLGLVQEFGCVLFFIVVGLLFLYVLAWTVGLIVKKTFKG
jgi:hypothetical protein